MKKIQLLIALSLFVLNVNAQEITKDNVNFTIRQIPTPAVKAFYIGRSFSVEQIKPYADTCVYTTTLRNDKIDKEIHYLRENWYASLNKKKHFIKTNAYWKKQFDKSKINPAQWIAFRLSQMPEEQIYAANGGWNQGILSVNVPHGSTFDLSIVWDEKGKQNELTLQGVSCEK